MKKTPLMLALVAMGALASCSQDEPADVRSVEGHAIDFRPAIGSRATETTNANLTSINVTAFMPDGKTPLFQSLDFNKGGDGFFTSSTKYYWPGDDSELTFYAYSPSQDELGADVTIDADTKELTSYSVPEDIADQLDFITATATGKKSLNESAGVELTFKHQLSQIELRAKTENTTYKYKVCGMRIGRAEYMGSFDFTTGKWTLDDWHDTAVYTSDCDTITLSSTPVSIMGDSGNAMLIPQTLTPWNPVGDPDNTARGAYLSVLVNIATAETGAVVYPFPSDTKLDDNGQKRQFAWASIPLDGTWEAGKKYVYILDFTNGAGNTDPDDPIPGKPVLGDAIKFSVNVEDWTEPADSILKPMTPVK